MGRCCPHSGGSFPHPQHLWKHLCRHTEGSVSFMIPNPVVYRDVTVVTLADITPTHLSALDAQEDPGDGV